MGYRIIYGGKDPLTKNKKAGFMPVIAVVCIFLLGIYIIGGGGGTRMQRFQQMLMPWTQPHVQEALDIFQTDLRRGVSFPEAAEAFCRELIHEADTIE